MINRLMMSFFSERVVTLEYSLISHLHWSLFDLYSTISFPIRSLKSFIDKYFILKLILRIATIVLFYWWLFVPSLLLKLFIAFLSTCFNILCRKSNHARKILINAAALYDSVSNSATKILRMNVSDLVIIMWRTSVEAGKVW